MIKHINGRPAAMMMPEDLPGDSSETTPTWDDIEPVKIDDIQTGRNVYIETRMVRDILITKASAGKIISCIKEGFMPVLKSVGYNPPAEGVSGSNVIDFMMVSPPTFKERDDGVFVLQFGETTLLYSDPSGDLSKPFTSIEPTSNSTPEPLTPTNPGIGNS